MNRLLPTICLFALVIALPACAGDTNASAEAKQAVPDTAANQDLNKAIFAAGCFWCVEQAFDEVEGVVSTTSGYTGGQLPSPSYEQVSAGGTGHREAVLVVYDPNVATYQDLLDNFWLNVDPTDDGGQFCDRGASYKSAIFYTSEKQQRLAQTSKQALMERPDAPSPIVTPILAATEFYAAEEYHQNYYQKNPLRYKYYKFACGRHGRLEDLWGSRAGGVG